MTDRTDDDDDDLWIPLPKGAAAEFDQMRNLWRDSVPELTLPSDGDIVNDRYEIVRTIGMGGFGCVFEARHVDLDQRFALKVLTPHIAQRPGWTERFREEARATSQIGHENIVFITDFGTCEEFGSYFVMEYLDGASLAEILEDGPLSVSEVLQLARSACAALDAANGRGIVHCDLKPANIFRVGTVKDPHWKLLDFGTSSIVMSTVETQTLYGTPKYMAPEQAMGGTIDCRADVFSLGVVLYEALTGKLPWETRMWLQATPQWREDHPPPRPSMLAPNVPPAWDDIVLKALTVSPDGRYSRAGRFFEALYRTRQRSSLRVAKRTMLPTPMDAGTLVELNPEAAFRSSLSPGEVFVMSRIEAGLTLGDLSRMCTGLGFDIDGTVRNMADRGYIVLQEQRPDARQPPRPRPTSPRPPPDTVDQSDPLDVERLLEHVDALHAQGNFLGALETLRSALTTWPDLALLHHRRGMLLREFGADRGKVLEAFGRAAELDPSNDEFNRALKRARNQR